VEATPLAAVHGIYGGDARKAGDGGNLDRHGWLSVPTNARVLKPQIKCIARGTKIQPIREFWRPPQFCCNAPLDDALISLRPSQFSVIIRYEIGTTAKRALPDFFQQIGPNDAIAPLANRWESTEGRY
jgi:hypothetical protein